jgi:hypothetical protein
MKTDLQEPGWVRALARTNVAVVRPIFAVGSFVRFRVAGLVERIGEAIYRVGDIVQEFNTRLLAAYEGWVTMVLVDSEDGDHSLAYVPTARAKHPADAVDLANHEVPLDDGLVYTPTGERIWLRYMGTTGESDEGTMLDHYQPCEASHEGRIEFWVLDVEDMVGMLPPGKDGEVLVVDADPAPQRPSWQSGDPLRAEHRGEVVPSESSDIPPRS